MRDQRGRQPTSHSDRIGSDQRGVHGEQKADAGQEHEKDTAGCEPPAGDPAIRYETNGLHNNENED